MYAAASIQRCAHITSARFVWISKVPVSKDTLKCMKCMKKYEQVYNWDQREHSVIQGKMFLLSRILTVEFI